MTLKVVANKLKNENCRGCLGASIISRYTETTNKLPLIKWVLNMQKGSYDLYDAPLYRESLGIQETGSILRRIDSKG